MMFWVWAILLLALGLGLAAMEVFFPSAGILGFLAASAIVASIIVGFQQGPGVGIIMLILAIFGVPVVLILGFRYWPRTAIGRRVLLAAPSSAEVLPDPSQREYLRGLIGRVGKAKCKMLPGGAVSIDGRTVDAVSEGEPIEAGQAVRVTQVRGNRVVVRPTEGEVPQANAEDPLRRPIDSIVSDPFEEKGIGD